jgi:erythromycin esterase-like protein
MWRNRETVELIEWLRAYNGEIRDPARQVSFSGLDLYSMYTSAYEVVRYLDAIDPAAAAVARERYGCLTPWQADPAVYGRAALTGRYRACEMDPRLERAIGVVYRPATELASHYFQAVLPVQFDEYIWFTETTAVAPLPVEPVDRPLARAHLFGT